MPEEKPEKPKPLPIGQRLKLAREEKGMSLELVHEATKVPLDALRAIEEGYTVRTMSPFYYKGFVKIYGEYLGVEVDDVVQKQEEAPVGEKLAQEYRQFFLRDLLSNMFTPRRIKQVAVILGLLVGFFLLFKIITAVFKGKDAVEPTDTVVNVQSPPKVKLNPQVNPQVKVEAPASQPRVAEQPQARPATRPATAPAPTPQPRTPTVTKDVTLTVRAKKESWLRVMADGQIVFQSTLETGEVETWLADKKIEIAGKNISQLEFELNGKLIGPLGRKDRNAKRIVITKDGLEVTN